MTPEQLQVYINHIVGPTSEQSRCLEKMIKESKKAKSNNGLPDKYTLEQLADLYKKFEDRAVHNKKTKITNDDLAVVTEILSDLILNS